MKGRLNQFLIYGPGALATMAIAAAGVWSGVRDQISAVAAYLLSWTSNPLAVSAAILFIATYIWAIYFTNEDGEKSKELKLIAKNDKTRRRHFVVTVGRSLASGYLNMNGNMTLLQYMQKDGGYARIRPHFSRSFKRKLLDSSLGKEEMSHALMDEMDRLERKWKLL